MTTAEAAFKSRQDTVFERAGKLLAQACAFPIGDVEALEELERAFTDAEAEADPAEQKRLASEAISRTQTQSFIRRFSRLNDRLMPLGRWISPTYLANSDVTDIEAMSDRLVALQSAGDKAATDALCEDIIRKVAMASFQPLMRAFMNLRATRLPHLADIAHYLETATLQFYRQDYFSVANTLIPAIERLLVSITGWRLATGGELHPCDYRKHLEGASMIASEPDLKLRFEAHRDELVRFLFDRFFKRSKIAKQDGTYDVSLINRAFSVHLNEPGSYYKFEDCVMYFQVFDLFIEFVASQHGKELPGVIPDGDPEVQKRTKEYWALIWGDWVKGGDSPERRLLQPTLYYITESEHNYLSMYDGVELNRLLFHALPWLDAKILLDRNLRADRREKLEWLFGHLAGTTP